MIHPPFLKPNDKAVILSPAGNISSEYINKTIRILTDWDLQVEVSENAICQVGRFSGTIDQRIVDLQKAIDDPEVKLVFCSRGGYGVVHLLDKLDFTNLKKNPKWIVGYSDITALHAALQLHNIMSIHGPMAEHFSIYGKDDVSVMQTRAILFGEEVQYKFPIDQPHLNKEGVVSGTLFGGNLSVYSALTGSKYSKIPRDGILLLEDIGEKPYKVDRMIYHLKIANVLKEIRGLVIGQFTDYEEDELMYNTLSESIFYAIKEYSFPVCFGFPSGHSNINVPLVLGAPTSLIIDRDFISLKQHF